MKYLECKAKFTNPHTTSFHCKLKLKDKIGGCQCGNIKLSGNCLSAIFSRKV